ncbi:MAG TPA: hypothetical protein VM370_11945 [Candidatus Thermoplasmatota archaeon]|nr:hypothetical protein [Candidatus Thermoplasmatota archaeon]
MGATVPLVAVSSGLAVFGLSAVGAIGRAPLVAFSIVLCMGCLVALTSAVPARGR